MQYVSTFAGWQHPVTGRGLTWPALLCVFIYFMLVYFYIHIFNLCIWHFWHLFVNKVVCVCVWTPPQKRRLYAMVLSICLSVRLFVRLFVFLSFETSTCRALAWLAQQCWQPWAAGAYRVGTELTCLFLWPALVGEIKLNRAL